MTRLADRVNPIVVEFLRTVASVESVKCSNCSFSRAVTSQAIITITTASHTSEAACCTYGSIFDVIGSVFAKALENCFAFDI